MPLTLPGAYDDIQPIRGYTVPAGFRSETLYTPDRTWLGQLVTNPQTGATRLYANQDGYTAWQNTWGNGQRQPQPQQRQPHVPAFNFGGGGQSAGGGNNMFGPSSPFFYAVQNMMGPMLGTQSSQVTFDRNNRPTISYSRSPEPYYVSSLNQALEGGANRMAGLNAQIEPYRVMGDTQRYMADTQRQIAESTNQLRAQTLQNVLPALMGPLSAALSNFGQGIGPPQQQPGPRDVRLAQGGPGAIGQLLQALLQQRGQMGA